MTSRPVTLRHSVSQVYAFTLACFSILMPSGCHDTPDETDGDQAISQIEVYKSLGMCNHQLNGCEFRTVIERNRIRWIDHEGTLALPASETELDRVWSLIESPDFSSKFSSELDDCQPANDSVVRIIADSNGTRTAKTGFHCPAQHPFSQLTSLLHELTARHIKCMTFDPRIDLLKDKLPVSLICFFCGPDCQS